MIRRISRLLGVRALMLWLARRERARLTALRLEVDLARRAAAEKQALWDAYIHAPTHREAARLMTEIMVMELRG